MIDTIRLRLHGILDTYKDTPNLIKSDSLSISDFIVPQHHELYVKLMSFNGKYFKRADFINREVTSKDDLTSSEFSQIENSKNLSFHMQRRKVMRLQDARTVKDVVWRSNGSWRLPSSYSGIAFSINEAGGFIDFEFSIPKYLYGHNLAEFIPQIHSPRKWKYADNLNSMDFQSKILYDRLFEFIDQFFTDLCVQFHLDTMPDLCYCELRRIDLCFNQYFDKKEDALTYFDYQTKINKKRKRKNSSKANEYDTSLYYISTTGSTFKIYHKGSEYISANGDMKRHMSINKPYLDSLPMTDELRGTWKENKDILFKLFEDKVNGKEIDISEQKKQKLNKLYRKFKTFIPFDVLFLKEQMDKVLRYEVSLTTPFFSYQYKAHLFRKNDKIHQQQKKNYKSNKAKDKRGENLPYNDLKNMKSFHKYLHQRSSFVMQTSKALNRHSKIVAGDYNELTQTYRISKFNYQYTMLHNKDVAFFSRELLHICYKHFKDHIRHFQIKSISGFDDLTAMIKAYNDNVTHSVEKYNELNNLDCILPNGDRKKKNGKKVMKAVSLLSDTEKRKLKLKKVNPNIMIMLVSKLQEGISLDQFKEQAGLNSSTFWRYKKDLEMFGIYQNSLSTQLDIKPPLDFKQYYWNADGIHFQDKFYIDNTHLNYDTKISA